MVRKGKHRRRRRSKPRLQYEESFTFSLSVGALTTITVGTLGGRPPRSNFRPIRMTIQACGAYVPGNDARAGYFAPVGIQAWFSEGQAKNATSGIICLSDNPKKITVSYPPSADWLSYDLESNVGIAQIEAVCIGPASNKDIGYVRGTAKLLVQLQPEIVVAGCPTRCLMDDPSAGDNNDKPAGWTLF